MDYSDQFTLDTLFLDIYPPVETPGSFILYEDDGKTLDYQTGGFAQTYFSVSAIYSGSNSSLNLIIGSSNGNYTGKPAKRIYVCEINTIVQTATLVDINGISASERNSYQSLRKSNGYYFDGSSKKLYVQIETVPDSTYQIAVQGIVLGVNNQANPPTEFSLAQNYPNPFNPVTNIEYRMPVSGKVVLKVYDILGREKATLVNEEKSAGNYSVQFNGSGISSGVYIYKLNILYLSKNGIESFSSSKKLILLK
jgi:hypothetical protein